MLNLPGELWTYAARSSPSEFTEFFNHEKDNPMTPENTERKSTNILKWFDLRGLDLSTFAFMMNRISGIGLTIYLFLHLVVLSQLARGPEAYDQFIALVKNPLFLLGEFLVVAAVLLHGLNGLRVALTSMGSSVQRQQQLFISLMVIALIGCVIFGIRMFGGE
jgi:succinate dehydrogenase / fumarate reductase cytochrome b subunit